MKEVLEVNVFDEVEIADKIGPDYDGKEKEMPTEKFLREVKGQNSPPYWIAFLKRRKSHS